MYPWGGVMNISTYLKYTEFVSCVSTFFLVLCVQRPYVHMRLLINMSASKFHPTFFFKCNFYRTIHSKNCWYWCWYAHIDLHTLICTHWYACPYFLPLSDFTYSSYLSCHLLFEFHTCKHFLEDHIMDCSVTSTFNEIIFV